MDYIIGGVSHSERMRGGEHSPHHHNYVKGGLSPLFNCDGQYTLLDIYEHLGRSQQENDVYLEKRLELALALEEQGHRKWAKRHLVCGRIRARTVMACKSCGAYQFHEQMCDIRGCVICSIKLANKLKHRYMADLKKHFNPKSPFTLRFLTLTFKNVNSIDELDYNTYLKSLQKFMHRVNVSRRIYKYIYKFECPNKTEEAGYNPHFHILYYGTFFPVRELSQVWSECSGGNPIVDIRVVKSVKGASNEIIKYCGKSNYFINPTENAKFLIKMKGRKFLGVSGFKRSPKGQLVCEECGGTDWEVIWSTSIINTIEYEITKSMQYRATLEAYL